MAANETGDDLENIVRQIANVVGYSSAAARAIKKLEEQRAIGNVAWLERHGSTILVVSAKSAICPQGEVCNTVKTSP